MKKSELITAIKEALLPEIEIIVTKKVAAAAKKIIQEQRKNTPKVVDRGTPSLGQLMNDTSDQREVKAERKYSKKQFAKNGILNDILNETAGQMKEYKSMGGGEYTSDMAQNFAAANPASAFDTKPSADQMVPEDRQGRQIPDAVANALTKDYSALVKSDAFTKRMK
jgi:hypothetical protein